METPPPQPQLLLLLLLLLLFKTHIFQLSYIYLLFFALNFNTLHSKKKSFSKPKVLVYVDFK
jgi:hypothetical protein